LTAAILTASFLGVTLADLLLYALNVGSSERVFESNGQTFLFAFVIAFGFGFSAYIYELSQAGLVKTREELRQSQMNVAQAERLATEAQLASLESRLQPHFLFNTLNSIAALIREEPKLAEETVEKLARLLRYSLDVNNKRLVEFAQELKITRDYLEVERVRFGERLEFYVEADEQFGKVEIPPFILQTLVENSIKHVAAKRSGSVKIWISAGRNDDVFVIEVRDNGAGFTTANIIEGHGVDTLQKRLAKIFAKDSAFKIIENTGGGCVRVHIPLTLKK
jgi:LytS/YehU family sensor histidine kinase